MSDADHASGAPHERAAEPPRLSQRRRILILIGVFVVMVFGALDQTIVGTAIPRIIADIGGMQAYSWIFTAYMLASTVTVPIYAKLSDLYGRRPFFLFGTILFILGSALAGVSNSMPMLILCRALQGLGAGAVLALGQTIVGDIFPPAERSKWHGLIAAVFGVVILVGPVAGGYVTDHWGWRWIFYINLPIGLLGLALSWVFLPRASGNRARRVDALGAALLVAAMVPLLLGLSGGGSQLPWTSAPILGLLSAALFFFVLLAVAERRAEEPIVPIALFRNDVYAISAAAILLLNMALFGAVAYLPLFVQVVQGATATDSGTILMPLLVSFIVSAIISSQIAARTRRYRILVLAMFALGTFGMYLFSRMDASTTQGTVMRNMVITGLGVGGLSTMFTIIVQNAVPPERLGEGTGGVQFFRSIGGALGVATLGSIMSNRFQALLLQRVPADQASGLTPGELDALSNWLLRGSRAKVPVPPPSIRGLAPADFAPGGSMTGTLQISLEQAISLIFTISACLLGVGVLITLFLREIPLRNTKKGEELPTDAKEAGAA
jgi:EmrB/QacA subfamily drug resistance transporter